uniref:(northern house mosquito) hypothetical protein n=1 Tax=Culex pipiens TaxID=7175 RepID=A0A8D8BZQ8_CULPI
MLTTISTTTLPLLRPTTTIRQGSRPLRRMKPPACGPSRKACPTSCASSTKRCRIRRCDAPGTIVNRPPSGDSKTTRQRFTLRQSQPAATRGPISPCTTSCPPESRI